MARRRRVSPETQRVLTERQARLTALTKHPSWEELVEEVGRKRTRIEKEILVKALGNPGPIDPDRVSYLKGFVHGMEWFAKVPMNAEGELERFLQEQGVLSE